MIGNTRAMLRAFQQVDVFTDQPYRGNPVAVVVDGDGLSTEQMQRLANWTNLSETTFVLPPTTAEADYRVRIFTPTDELPFAGHPTLGTCHAWLSAGNEPRQADQIIQECGVGLVPIRRIAVPDTDSPGLAFAAPPPVRTGPLDHDVLTEVLDACSYTAADVVAAEWVVNGPEWLALLVRDVDTVLATRPRFVNRFVGLIALQPAEADSAIEVRAFFPQGDLLVEDPVTGSLNASVAQWLLSSGRLTPPYVASQGRILGRDGRVHIDHDGDAVWVGGQAVTCISGTIDI